jgi:hypothetical protein
LGSFKVAFIGTHGTGRTTLRFGVARPASPPVEPL